MTEKEDPIVEPSGEEKKEATVEKSPAAEKAEKTAADAAEKSETAEKPAKAAADAVEKPATEKPATIEKPAAAKPAAAEKPVADKPAATAKPAAAKPAAAGAAKPAAAKTASSVETKSEPESFKIRRRLIWTSIAAFLGAITLATVRFFLPRTLFEPSTIFRVGYPADFGIGVETKFQNQYRIWVVKNAERLFIIYAKCPHLGCTPDWVASENKFKCPCHGSGYDIEGINFEGPAPRPMDRAKVALDAEGQIVVDTSKLYQWPKGARSQFDDDGSFIQL
jgi:cytochrome b6-f complex iron-sulfur subunit